MIQINKVHELNHDYLILSEDFIKKTEDFRFRMLLSNCIDGVIPLQTRTLNGKKEVFFDVTEKEPISESFSGRKIGRAEIKELFGEILKVSVGIERFLIDEGNLIMRPEMIYRNLKDGCFEFVCVPDFSEDGSGKNESLVELMRFITERIDTGDEVLTECVYGLFDMVVLNNVSAATIYEVLTSELREIKIVEESNDLLAEKEEKVMEKKEKKTRRYVPTWKELGAVAMCLTGLALLGTNLFTVIAH